MNEYKNSNRRKILKNAINLGAVAAGTTALMLDTSKSAVAAPTLVTSTGSTFPRSLEDRFADVVNVKDFGAIGDGSYSRDELASADTAAAAAGKLLFISAGTYYIQSNITLSSVTYFDDGAMLIVPAGVTVNFDGAIEAPLSQIFNLTGTGLVTLSPKFTPIGYPEWWGAVTGGPDCLSALEQCYAAVGITQLSKGDYFISATWKLQLPNKEVRGRGWEYNGVSTDTTRIIALDGSSTCILIGYDTMPVEGINSFLRGVKVSNFQVSRAQNPEIGSNCAGIKSQFTLYERIKDVQSVESMRGFEFEGCVGIQVDDCYALRSIAGANGNDYWNAFYVNGNTVIPASGGNASIYLRRCSATLALLIDDSRAFLCDNAWADTFITEPECSGTTYGIELSGNGSNTFDYRETDIHISRPILDRYYQAGIYIHDASRYGSISIQGGWTAAAVPDPVPTNVVGAVYINNSLCPITIQGMLHTLGPASSTVGGLVIVNSNNVTSIGNLYQENKSHGAVLSTANHCHIQDRSSNYNITALTCAQLTTSEKNYIQMMCSGDAGKIAIGYQLISTANGHNELNCTGLDSNSINGGAGNKLIINGVQVTATGLYNTNLVSGVMT